MSNSTRVDTVSLIPGACVVGVHGLGIPAATIRATTATGDHGPGLLYNEWDGPEDDEKELRALVESAPSSGTLFVNEDGSFTLIGASDGTYTINYRIFADGVDLGTTSATLSIGVVGVSSDLTASYTIRGSAAADLTASYAIRTSAQQDLAATYAVRTSATQDLAAEYAVRAAAQADFTADYSIENAGVVLSDFSAVYAVLGSAQRDLAAEYGVQQAVASDFEGAFAVRTSAQASLAGAYDVLASVASDLTASWGIAGTVTSSFAAAYTIQGSGGADPGAVWGYLLPNGLTAAQTLVKMAQQVDELHRIHGLQIDFPLLNSPTGRSAGDIIQTHTVAGGAVTTQREP